jgi:hypothetical protein
LVVKIFEAPVCLTTPPILKLKVVPPVAVNVTFVPKQETFPGAELVRVGTGKALTVMVPDAETVPQPPVSVTVYENTPAATGVPLIVTTLDAQLPVTPEGSPVTVAPVAPIVA